MNDLAKGGFSILMAFAFAAATTGMFALVLAGFHFLKLWMAP